MQGATGEPLAGFVAREYRVRSNLPSPVIPNECETSAPSRAICVRDEIPLRLSSPFPFLVSAFCFLVSAFQFLLSLSCATRFKSLPAHPARWLLTSGLPTWQMQELRRPYEA